MSDPRSTLPVVVFVAHGMSRQNERLQPWRYIAEIARHMAATGRHEVQLITDGPVEREDEDWAPGLRLVRTRFLSTRHRQELALLIQDLAPHQLWWSVTPRSIIYWPMLRSIKCQKFAFITCPLYTYAQLARASLAGVPYSDLSGLWKQRLVPRGLFSAFLRSGLFTRIFVQSESNREILQDMQVPRSRLSLLRVGIDATDRAEPSDEVRKGLTPGRPPILLYFGSPKKIRGFDALLRAFSMAQASGIQARLLILARGATDAEVKNLHEAASRQGIGQQHIEIQGGWLSRVEVWHHISACAAAVLPFVVVPSDVPIAILESMARGKPVIGSNVDGIPELIRDRGVIVDPLNTRQFADAMIQMAHDHGLRESLGQNAKSYMATYPLWHDIGQLAMHESGLR